MPKKSAAKELEAEAVETATEDSTETIVEPAKDLGAIEAELAETRENLGLAMDEIENYQAQIEIREKQLEQAKAELAEAKKAPPGAYDPRETIRTRCQEFRVGFSAELFEHLESDAPEAAELAVRQMATDLAKAQLEAASKSCCLKSLAKVARKVRLSGEQHASARMEILADASDDARRIVAHLEANGGEPTEEIHSL